ncbi:MAG: hypothetical protein IT332_13130 [Ardenticatenales bacterium]|nr:hypothetical protein [Ardenticatenales bacterium]
MKRFASVLAAAGIALGAAAWTASAALAQVDGRAADTPAPASPADLAPDLALQDGAGTSGALAEASRTDAALAELSAVFAASGNDASEIGSNLLPQVFTTSADHSPDTSTADDDGAFTAEDMAAVMRSRIWWHDYGSFGGYPVGTVYSLGGEVTDDGFLGIKFDYAGRAGNMQRGFGWYPFVHSNSNLGLVLDLTYRVEKLTLVGVDTATERLGFRNSNGSTAIWSSTRSPYTPATIRSLFYR